MLLLGFVVLGYLRVRHVLIGAVLLTGIVFAVAPGYLERMDSIRGVSDMDSVNDAAMRGRMTEMLAAWNVLLDHPLVGVGPGQYTPFYSVDYMDDPGVAYRQIDKERRAHSLYFELGAETGLLGLGLFLALTASVFGRLQRVRRNADRDSESRDLAAGLLLGMVAYLGTSFFLSLAFMRYWWLLLALACVAVRLSKRARPVSVSPEAAG
jgi:O-antigen ligase